LEEAIDLSGDRQILDLIYIKIKLPFWTYCDIISSHVILGAVFRPIGMLMITVRG
jgi:hypothetical protein